MNFSNMQVIPRIICLDYEQVDINRSVTIEKRKRRDSGYDYLLPIQILFVFFFGIAIHPYFILQFYSIVLYLYMKEGIVYMQLYIKQFALFRSLFNTCHGTILRKTLDEG